MKQTNNLPMLGVLYAAAFASAFNENIMNVALVDIMTEFSVSSNTAQWLVTGYMAVTAVVVALMAFLMRRFGVRKLFFAASACFVVGEVVGFLAPNFATLLASRLLQAVGSGAFATLMMSSVLALAPREKMGTFLSIGSAAITLGPALAPVVSGFEVTLLGWRTVFLAPAAVGAVVALAGVVLVRDYAEIERVGLDVPSLALMALSLPLFVFGLGKVVSNPVVGGGAIAVAAAMLVAFARRQESVENPVLNVRPLLHEGSFALAALLVVVAMMTTFSMGILLPLYFQSAFGMTALLAGVCLLPAIAVNAGTALVAGRIMDRRGPWPLLPAGFAFIVIGQFVIALVAKSMLVPVVVIASIAVYAGVGLAMSPSQTAGLGVLPRREHADGVAMMNTLIMVAASFGPSLFVGVMSSGAQSAGLNGADSGLAQAVGFSQAVTVAAVIAALGLVVSLFLAYDLRYRRLAPIVLEPELPDPDRRAAPTLRAVMRADAYVVEEGATVRDVARILVQTHTSGVPIVDGGRKVKGFLSDGDILRAFSAQHAPDFDLGYYVVSRVDEGFESDEAFAALVDRIMSRPALELATCRVVVFEVDTPLEDVVSQLRSKQFKKIPVVEDGRLVGTVSRNDVMRYLMEVLAA